jgi:hypothetical protein
MIVDKELGGERRLRLYSKWVKSMAGRSEDSKAAKIFHGNCWNPEFGIRIRMQQNDTKPDQQH